MLCVMRHESCRGGQFFNKTVLVCVCLCVQEKSELDSLEDFRTPTSRIASFLTLSAKVPETLVAITPQRDTAQP